MGSIGDQYASAVALLTLPRSECVVMPSTKLNSDQWHWSSHTEVAWRRPGKGLAALSTRRPACHAHLNS